MALRAPKNSMGNVMDWLYLIIAGVLEIAWAIGLKYTDGFTKPGPSILTGLAMVASMRMSVVFPAPLGPRIAKIMPRGTSRSIPSTAGMSPKRLWSPRALTARSACSGHDATVSIGSGTVIAIAIVLGVRWGWDWKPCRDAVAPPGLLLNGALIAPRAVTKGWSP